VYAVADWTTATVAKCLADLIYRHGVPISLIHDRAPEILAQFYAGYQTASKHHPSSS